MAKAWDIEPSIFAGMIEEDVGLGDAANLLI